MGGITHDAAAKCDRRKNGKKQKKLGERSDRTEAKKKGREAPRRVARARARGHGGGDNDE